MQRGFRTQYMARKTRKDPKVVIEGIEEVLEKDLKKHRKAVEQANLDFAAYREARSHEKRKKAHYSTLVGGEKFNDSALGKGMEQCDINIRHMSDKMKLSRKKIDHHTEIVVRLEKELKDQYESLKELKEHRKNGAGD